MGPGCYFHDITTGTNAMPCVTLSANCGTTIQGDAYGILSGNAAGSGYDKASGLGSVDAANLVNAWTTTGLTTSSAVLSILPVSVAHGSAVTATVTVTGKSPTGQVSLNTQTPNGSVGAGPLVNGTLTQSFRSFPGGTYGVRAHYEGDAQNYPADSNFVSITVTPEPSSTTLKALAFNPTTGATSTPASAPYGTIFYVRADVAGASGQGVATGNVQLTDNGSILGAGVSRLNSSGYTEFQTNAFTPGSHNFAASYTGDASFNASSASGASLTITQAATTTSLTAAPSPVSQANTVTLSATVATTGYGFLAPSGQLTFMAGTLVLGSSTLAAGTDPGSFFRNATATLTISAGALPPGTNNITAVFPGDANYTASTSPGAAVNVTLSLLPSCSAALLITPGQVAPGGMIVLGATITPAVTGTVQFAIDGQNVATPVTLSNSQGAYGVSVTPYTVGLHSATAVYSGGASYRSCTSAPTPFFITAPTALGVPTFTVTPSTGTQGTFLSVAVQVTPPTATGRVQLVLDGAPYGATFALNGAAATLPLVTTTLQTGPHSLTVYYLGDINNAPSYAMPQTITILPPGTTPSAVAITNLGPTINQGFGGNFTVTVTPQSPTPTGIFELTLDGGNPGAPMLLTGAVNTLTLPAAGLTPGTHTLSVFYSGDATYNVATSSTVTYQVISPVVTGSFTLSPATATLIVSRLTSNNPTLTYHLLANGGFTGLVQFSCTNLPVNTACVFAPGTVNVTGAGDFTTTLRLVLNTGVKTSSLPISGLTVAMLVGLGLGFRRRRRIAALCTLACLVAIGGCGGGYQAGDSSAGTYAVTVIATSGSITQTSTITLTIQ